MLFIKYIEEEFMVKYIDIAAAVHFGDEQIPYDAPLRFGDIWIAKIDIEEKRVVDWPKGKELDLYIKVADQGTYVLRDSDGEAVASRVDDYVPNALLPGEYGDYLHLDIDADGVIKNWLPEASLHDFE